MKYPLALLMAAASAAAQDAPIPAFEAQTIDGRIQIGYGIAAGDVDGDGRIDLLLADKKEFVWYRNPDWKKHVMARDLTPRDNVCVAARDIDGDGKVEVAVGAQWNPGETRDEAQSGAVFYLVPPADVTQPWTPVKLVHEPTVHRMKWVRVDTGEFKLLMAPLHGRGNDPASGAGDAARLLAYDVPADVTNGGAWTASVADATLHKTHNLDVRPARRGPETVWLGGMEGVRRLTFESGKWRSEAVSAPGLEKGVGEIRAFGSDIIALIQPMHGNQVSLYHQNAAPAVLDESLAQGHALVCEPLLGRGFPEVVAGWREPDKSGKVGIKMFVRDESTGVEKWVTHIIDDNKMACEDLIAADLDGDKRPELIAAGRATRNVVIYWNKTPGAAPVSRERPELPALTNDEKAAIESRKREREGKPEGKNE
jgi:hypothetical protein